MLVHGHRSAAARGAPDVEDRGSNTSHRDELPVLGNRRLRTGGDRTTTPRSPPGFPASPALMQGLGAILARAPGASRRFVRKTPRDPNTKIIRHRPHRRFRQRDRSQDAWRRIWACRIWTPAPSYRACALHTGRGGRRTPADETRRSPAAAAGTARGCGQPRPYISLRTQDAVAQAASRSPPIPGVRAPVAGVPSATSPASPAAPCWTAGTSGRWSARTPTRRSCHPRPWRSGARRPVRRIAGARRDRYIRAVL